ncbi:MAG TPA: hypothetical protein VFP58_07830 [Candidatus Eisenbacteria bacterium]|nr:hypothetical protein [Candidatus Eisenbacteria bacterium]
MRRLVLEAPRLVRTEMFLETDIPEFDARLGAVRDEPLTEGGWIMRIGVSRETTARREL